MNTFAIANVFLEANDPPERQGTVNLKRLLATGVASGALLVTGLAAAPPAQAENVIHIASFATNRCLDDSAAYGLRPFVCNGSDYQAWSWTGSDSSGTLVNRATGQCLDDTTDGLRAMACDGSGNQNWNPNATMQDADINTRTWKSDGTNRCLDDSLAHGLRTLDCNDGDYQRFSDVN
ncbi:MAG TPA: ricin-type beta-trefoil lectin domain protein [Streptosporangiaceae bacterium]